ncbi:hypothetical protein EC973_000190 [Apophysomyces ossiformis]|uniref:Mediator of RNA polymerase II transcription subunit 21 n=1 Tax=Apophysomyces ossiformis TaxID=679940 RepID=A0A8H7BS32_9FUNG|nr:hypothetical protein EC973_000190 [Apophysomyces ossiformis]
MDRVTQLQDSIDAMARMFTNSIHYVHEKSAMAELNKDIPVAQQKVQAESPEIFQANMQELVTDLVKKAKEIDALIEVLPGIKHSEDDQIRKLQDLEEENKLAHEDYELAVREMAVLTPSKLEAVRDKVTMTLRTIADEQSRA